MINRTTPAFKSVTITFPNQDKAEKYRQEKLGQLKKFAPDTRQGITAERANYDPKKVKVRVISPEAPELREQNRQAEKQIFNSLKPLKNKSYIKNFVFNEKE